MTLRTRLLVALGLVAVTALSSAGGYVARPFITKDGVRLSGLLTAVAFRPTVAQGCAAETTKQVALARFVEDTLFGALAKLMLPREAFATSTAAGCRVTAMRAKKNLIVNAGEAFLVDAWQNIVELEIMKYHGIGTGAVAAGETDTGCGTESTTALNPDNTRATGSLTEASASVFRTVGTNTVDATVAATEWCLMSQAATGGGTMWSRVVFTVINLASGDSLQTTYDLTVE